MPARILRWKGGYAGDMLLYVMHLSGHRIINVVFRNNISDTGRVEIDFAHTSGDLTAIDRLALNHCRGTIDHDTLKKEIESLDGDVWIKSHYFCDEFDDITTDITVDAASLPFVMAANVYKTETVTTHDFHRLAGRVKDPDLRAKLALYNVGQDSLNTVTSSESKISISDLIQGWPTLCSRSRCLGIQLDAQAEDFYHHWYDKNKKYFASPSYLDLCHRTETALDHHDLNIIERYALMVLRGQRFRIL